MSAAGKPLTRTRTRTRTSLVVNTSASSCLHCAGWEPQALRENGAGTCAGRLWEGLGIRDYVPSTAPVQRRGPWPSLWGEKPLNGSSPSLGSDVSRLPAWAAEALCGRQALRCALCPDSSPTKSVSMTHAGGSRPLSLGVLLHIVTDQRGLNTSQAMPWA